MNTELSVIKPDEISLQDWTAAVVSNIPAYTPIRPGLLDTTRVIVAVADEDENALAIRYAGDVAAEIKAADAHYKPFTDALYQLHRRGTGLRDNILAPIKGEFDRLKCLSGAYQRERDRKAREKADAAAKAAREAADAERRRIEAEAQEHAAELEAQGRTAEAEAAIEQAVEAMAEVRPDPVIIPPPAAPVAGSAMRTDYKPDYEHANIAELVMAAARNPEAYLGLLTWNEKACNALARAQGEACRIPGLPIIGVQSMAIRASK